jgi:hypothetical protein
MRFSLVTIIPILVESATFELPGQVLAQVHDSPIRTSQEAESVMNQIAHLSEMIREWMTEEKCLEYQAQVDLLETLHRMSHFARLPTELQRSGQGLKNIISYACPCTPEILHEIVEINSSPRLKVRLDAWTRIGQNTASKECEEFAITISERALYKPISNEADYTEATRNIRGCIFTELHWARIGRCRALSKMIGEWEASHPAPVMVHAPVRHQPPVAPRAPIPIHEARESIESRRTEFEAKLDRLRSERTELGTGSVSVEAKETFSSRDEKNIFIAQVMRLIAPNNVHDPERLPSVSIYEVTRKFNQLIDPDASGETLINLLAADKSYWLRYGILWILNSRLSDDSPTIIPSSNHQGLCASFDSLGLAGRFAGCKKILGDPLGLGV